MTGFGRDYVGTGRICYGLAGATVRVGVGVGLAATAGAYTSPKNSAILDAFSSVKSITSNGSSAGVFSLGRAPVSAS
jgi:hypothetical protein